VLRKAYLILYTLYLEQRGSFVGVGAKFADEPVWPHGITGIFISGAAQIGCDCVIFHHVTIGSNSLPDSRGLGAPTIGDHCYIGAGASIIGNVKIGDYVRIGANAVVTQDVPSNSVVVSQPVRIIRKPELNNRFYFPGRGVWMYREGKAAVVEKDETVLAKLSQFNASGRNRQVSEAEPPAEEE
jgi:serine O-acetyltransferase